MSRLLLPTGSFRSVLFSLTFVGALLSPGVLDAGTPFVHQTVDTAGDVGPMNSLALDAQGNPHILYHDNTNNDMKYARLENGVWSIEVVDANVIDHYMDMTLAADGTPRIVYISGAWLAYGERVGGVWNFEQITQLSPLYGSIALDAAGNPRISSYRLANDGDLYYHERNGGVWTSTKVESTLTAGQWCSLALDSQGNPHIAYRSTDFSDLKHAERIEGVWSSEIVDETGSAGQHPSIAIRSDGTLGITYFDATNDAIEYAERVGGAWTTERVGPTVNGPFGEMSTTLVFDGQGNPHAAFYDAIRKTLMYASRRDTSWQVEAVTTFDDQGQWSSLALDSQGNPHISYYDLTSADLRYANSAVQLAAPTGGETWPVGALRTVSWELWGAVHIDLSTDGGQTYSRLVESSDMEPGFNSYELRVPHTPSRFARLRIERLDPPSMAESDSFFTIEADIALLSLKAGPPSAGLAGALVSWETNPGPKDLLGYRLERRDGSGDWRTVESLTTKSEYHDADAKTGSTYRLSGVNGFGTAQVLGEIQFLTPRVLAAWPLPLRGGDLTIQFAAASGFAGGTVTTSVDLFDASGRLVRRIVSEGVSTGLHTRVWDGKDDRGREVRPGIYYLRLQSAGLEESQKILVIQ